MKNNGENKISDIEKYLEDNDISAEEYIKTKKIEPQGLTNEEANKRIEKYGYNETKRDKQKKWYNYFFQSLFTPFNSILLGIAIVLSYTDIMIAETPSYANIIVIICLVLISTLLEFFE